MLDPNTYAGPNPFTRCPEGWRPARTPDLALEADAETIRLTLAIIDGEAALAAALAASEAGS